MQSLSGEEYKLFEEEYSVIDLVGLYKPRLDRLRIVSFLEPGCEYDNVAVRNEQEAIKILEKDCTKGGSTLTLFRLEDTVQINWDKFRELKPKPELIRKGKPLFYITSIDRDLPRIVEQ